MTAPPGTVTGAARLAALVLACASLQACHSISDLNVLAKIDGPFVSPAERARLAQQDGAAGPADGSVSGLPAPAVVPPPVQVAGTLPPPPRVPAAAAATSAERTSAELERRAEAMGLSVVSAMPAPASAAPSAALPAPAGADFSASAIRAELSAYRAFYDFALTRLDQPSGSGARESMLLADPISLDPALQGCGNLPPAVLIDLDPANGLLPLVGQSPGDPVLARYLGLLRDRGVTVYWISGHAPDAAGAIRRRLTEGALDPTGSDPLIVSRFASESKQDRRRALGQTNCLLAILGDQRDDFDELYDFVLDPALTAPLDVLLGHGWFLAPTPLG